MQNTATTETKCYCAACETGAGKCRRLWTDVDWLDAYGFAPSGRTRPVGKGREIHGRHAETPRDVYEAVKRLF
jgi:hypothetical protein